MHAPRTFIVDYAYGFRMATCEPDYVSKLRSRAALRAFRTHPGAYIVLGAGMKNATGDCGPLAAMIEKYLCAAGVPPENIIMNPRGDNTLAETEAAYDLVAAHGGGKIICATSAFHAPRVFLIWLLRFGRLPAVYASGLKPRRREYLYEALKIVRDSVRSLARRFVS